MRVERVLTWLCWLALVVFAFLQSLAVATSLLEGRIRQFAKYGVGREVVLGQEPTAFFAAVIFYLLVAGAFWYFAYWVWSNRLRSKA